MSKHRLLIEWALLALLLAVLAIATSLVRSDTSPISVRRLDLVIYDSLQRLVSLAPAPELLIVEIDDESLAQFGRWPWPRILHAELIAKLNRAGAKAVALDVLLVETAPDDSALAAALAASAAAGLRVVLPVTSSGQRSGRVLPLYPLAEFGLPARLGHAHFRIDEDGVVRGLHLDEAGFPALSLALAAELGGTGLPVIARNALADASQQRRDEAVARGQWDTRRYVLLPRLNATIASVSYGDVMRGAIDPALLRERVVLIGSAAAGLGDRYANSIIERAALSPGVELHAAAFSAIRHDKLILQTPDWLVALCAAALVVVLMVALYRLRPRTGLLATVAAIALALSIAALALRAGFWLPPSAALLALILAYPLWSWRRLEVATAGLVRQAESLRIDPPLLPPRRPERLPSEPIARSLQQLNEAANRSLTLRRFLQMTLQRMPHPAFVTDALGGLVFANERLQQAFGQSASTGEIMTDWLLRVASIDLGGSDPAHDHLERNDSTGRDWLIDRARFEDPEWSAATLVQLVDISPIRAAQREREQMLRFLSHDLRSPLLVILAIVDRAGRRGDQPGSEWLPDVQIHAERSLELADGFVQLARAEAKAIAAEVTDLADLVTEATDACWLTAQTRSIRLAIEGVREGATVCGDAQLLRRALVNLIENAIKFNPDGGQVTVCMATASDPEGAPQWSVTVSDQGKGLTDAERERLFEPYWRGAGARAQPGVGLGLSFVRIVAERHFGSVAALRPATIGAQFELRIPAWVEGEFPHDSGPAL